MPKIFDPEEYAIIKRMYFADRTSESIDEEERYDRREKKNTTNNAR